MDADRTRGRVGLHGGGPQALDVFPRSLGRDEVAFVAMPVAVVVAPEVVNRIG